MELRLSTFLIVCPLVFLAGFVDSIAGGGGVISLPAYFLAGLPPHLAAGTNKFVACLGTLTSTIKYFKSGKVQLFRALCTGVGALIGGAAGAAAALGTSAGGSSCLGVSSTLGGSGRLASTD